MKKSIFIFFSLVLVLYSCKEGSVNVYETQVVINITSPTEDFVILDNDSLFIKVETNIDESLINSIEVFSKFSSESDENKIVEFIQPPFEEYIFIYTICDEIDSVSFYAKLYYDAGKEKVSDKIIGTIIKNIPPDDSLPTFDYKGYDLDSNLVTEGTFTMYIKDNYYIYGRKNIVAVLPDSSFEKGTGYLEGFKFQSVDGEYHLEMNVCHPLLNTGLYPFIEIHGNLINDEFVGIRYLSGYGPESIKVGTFRAVKIN